MFEPLIDVDANLDEPVADIATSATHDLDGKLDLLGVGFLEQNAVVDQHDRHNAGFAQTNSGQPQHFSAAGLHGEIVERALIGTMRDVQRPAKYTLQPAI